MRDAQVRKEEQMKGIPLRQKPELVHEQVCPFGSISPAPENDQIYPAISVNDVQDLVRSVREHGVQEPLLVSTDGFIISGHRRRFTAQWVGLSEAPVRIYPVSRRGNDEEFVKLLVEMNSQRIKALRIVEEQRDYWRLTVRQIHYRLLGSDAPTYHASVRNSKPSSAATLRAFSKVAIEQVIALDLINQELKAEEADSARIVAVQQRTAEFFRS